MLVIANAWPSKCFLSRHLPWEKRQQPARGCGDLESNALDGGRVARVLGGNTGGSQVATCMPDGRVSHAALWHT